VVTGGVLQERSPKQLAEEELGKGDWFMERRRGKYTCVYLTSGIPWLGAAAAAAAEDIMGKGRRDCYEGGFWFSQKRERYA
jgi:hypothetical protein